MHRPTLSHQVYSPVFSPKEIKTYLSPWKCIQKIHDNSIHKRKKKKTQQPGNNSGAHQQVDKQTHTSWHPHKTEYYSAIKLNTPPKETTHTHLRVALNEVSTKDYSLREVLKQARLIHHDRNQNIGCLGVRVGNCQESEKATLSGVEGCFIALAVVVTRGLCLSILIEFCS